MSLVPAAEKLLSDLAARKLQPDEYDEIAARLWMVEQECRGADPDAMQRSVNVKWVSPAVARRAEIAHNATLRKAAQDVVDALPYPLRTASDGNPQIDTLTALSPQIATLRHVLEGATL